MSVFTYINLEHRHPSPENITVIADQIGDELNGLYFLKPRTIFIVDSGMGAGVVKHLQDEGHPVELMGYADWQQMVLNTLEDGPTNKEAGETCL
jgi:hypothetical protein